MKARISWVLFVPLIGRVHPVHFLFASLLSACRFACKETTPCYATLLLTDIIEPALREELGKYFFLDYGACNAVYREIESGADKELESKLTAGPWAEMANKSHQRRD